MFVSATFSLSPLPGAMDGGARPSLSRALPPSLHAHVLGSTEWVCTDEPVTFLRRANTRVQTLPRDYRRERRHAGWTLPPWRGKKSHSLPPRKVEGHTPRPPPRRPARHALGSTLSSSGQPPSDTSLPVHKSAELPISLLLTVLLVCLSPHNSRRCLDVKAGLPRLQPPPCPKCQLSIWPCAGQWWPSIMRDRLVRRPRHLLGNPDWLPYTNTK